jgi:hypothetical protein
LSLPDDTDAGRQTSPNSSDSTINDIIAAAEATVRESVSKIAEIASSVDAINLFAAMLANMALGPAEHMREMTHGDVPAKLELLAYHIYPHFGESAEHTITPWHTQHCWEALEKLFIARMQCRAFSQYKTVGNNQIDSLMRSLRMHTEIVRGSAYPEQTKEEVLSIQGKFDSWFRKVAGIDPTRAMHLLWGIAEAQEDAANDFMKDVLVSLHTFGELWEVAKKKPQTMRTGAEQQLLSVCADKKTARIFGYVKRLNELAPSRLPVTSSSLKSIEPPPSEEEWVALCELIGLTVEKRKIMHDSVEVRQMPLFVLPDNRVLLADISNASDCLWESFEHIAKTDQSFYDTQYQRRKAEWLESKVLSLLKEVFPPRHIYRKLSYPDPDKSNGSTAELDLAVLWPPFIVLIEVKARQFRMESQLGDPGRLRTDVKANIEDAYEQAKRALRYIDAMDKPEFIEIGTGRKLSFEKHGIYRTYLLTVSQHHFAGLVNRFAELQGLGLFKSGEYPLSICIADLEMILEFCNGPDVFLHYIEKRLEILRERIEIRADELDFFGAYLSCRLRAERLWRQGNEPADLVSLGGWSEKFDEIMEHKRGEREKAPTLALEVPIEIRDVLDELRRRTNDPGARWIAFSLLGMSDTALGSIAQSLREVRAASLTPGMFRRVVHQDGDTVISIVASLDLPPAILRERTKLRAILEKYRRKASKSIGIGIMVADGRRPFDCATWVEGPWQNDENLEKALEKEPPFVLAPGQKLPGRNEPCVCGSGKKFKKCCLPKIEMNK